MRTVLANSRFPLVTCSRSNKKVEEQAPKEFRLKCTTYDGGYWLYNFDKYEEIQEWLGSKFGFRLTYLESCYKPFLTKVES